jgi:SsrA-binding protein
VAQEKVVATNRKAYHDYFIEEKIEAGVALQGNEVKSLRLGRANLKDSYARIVNGEVLLYNTHISPYEHGDLKRQDPKRVRKLLLHKAEIRKLAGKVTQKSMTLVPLRIYFSGDLAKVEIGLVRGKRQYDKRRAIAEKTAKRELEKEFRQRQKEVRK